MSTPPEDRQHLHLMERNLGALLRYGALVASGWMAVGMALSLFKDVLPLIRLSDRCLAIGIVLLIVLPVLRVALMVAVFVLERDYRLAAIACAVLGIIALGFLLGTINLQSRRHALQPRTDNGTRNGRPRNICHRFSSETPSLNTDGKLEPMVE
jgi:uncharacterized membrane protein